MQHPEFMQIRRAVRRALAATHGHGSVPAVTPLALVGLSGGADSLSLAAALAQEAPAAGWRAGALLVDHGLQHASSDTAGRAAEQARTLGLDPVLVRRVAVQAGSGPEAAARDARYAAFADVAEEVDAAAILTAHTRDDQAEQVLLALARGSGTRSIAGIPPQRAFSGGCLLLRPLLDPDSAVTRATTVAACAELGLVPWNDPHNVDPGYARVRVRERLLPALTSELGPGVAAGLARSADLAREDAEALDAWAGGVAEALGDGTARPARAQGEPLVLGEHSIAVLAELPAAVRQRVIHRVARDAFGASLTREHTLAIAELVTHWRGQGPAFAPGIRVTRTRSALRFERQVGSPRPRTSPRAES